MSSLASLESLRGIDFENLADTSNWDMPSKLDLGLGAARITLDGSRFITEIALLDNVSLQVTELTGSPGDAYFTDLRLLHSLGPNASERPRLMVTQRLPRVSAAARMSAIHQALAESRQRALR